MGATTKGTTQGTTHWKRRWPSEDRLRALLDSKGVAGRPELYGLLRGIALLFTWRAKNKPGDALTNHVARVLHGLYSAYGLALERGHAEADVIEALTAAVNWATPPAGVRKRKRRPATKARTEVEVLRGAALREVQLHVAQIFPTQSEGVEEMVTRVALPALVRLTSMPVDSPDHSVDVGNLGYSLAAMIRRGFPELPNALNSKLSERVTDDLVKFFKNVSPVKKPAPKHAARIVAHALKAAGMTLAEARAATSLWRAPAMQRPRLAPDLGWAPDGVAWTPP
jgi:hypothetical protein